MPLQDSAMLVSLTITQWSARKLDRAVSYEVCNTKHADMDSGRFNKQIIPKKYLAHIQQLVSKIRNYHYANTLPWQHKGADLLPSRHYLKYTQRMGQYEDKFNKAVKEFLNSYPTIIKQVQNSLSDLYDLKDYPDVDQIRGRFYMNIAVTPVPDANDFRIDINQKELDKLKSKLDEQLQLANQLAEQELFSRLYSALAKAVITLKTPDKIFRNTLVLNIEDQCEKITTMNFNENQALSTKSDSIKQFCKLIDIDLLRDKDNPMYRVEVAQKLEVAMKDVELIFTGANDDINTRTNDDEGTQQTAAG